mmetsp:Transcript_30427/g.47665  ORF Transcript_30427/g.47665 Transcript_30427/m.47665 type:complete len:292 (-) Transcript_30427:281-1156(-)|eukprot:CAMPEP_0184302010 /NCGR_PEP_ID=MMETSP1049-20130417/12090_1 /TAXON_ID=77928 /ORGANISM="Proteomonas sulcata, Strain CCMP704" /LENGTH=291 /DNA_ID=CAMNT_0026613177 /DNA_START=161 /DNA_END=1036 /DNA_ORIENTATION=+
MPLSKAWKVRAGWWVLVVVGLGWQTSLCEGEKDHDDPNQAHLTYGNNPLHDAAKNGDHAMLKKILDGVPGIFADNRFSKWEYDEPEDYPTHNDKNDGGNTPLHLATWLNQKESVKILIEKGASVHVKNRAGNYPVQWAARHNDTTIMKLLIEKGADVKTADNAGFTALHFCAFANTVEACRILLDNGADVNAQTDKGYSPICTAAEHHMTAVAELLIDRGADVVEVEDENGNGPMDLASGRAATKAYEGLDYQIKLVEMLRDHGARYAEERAKQPKAKKDKKKKKKQKEEM